MKVTVRKTCRLCGSDSLTRVLDLGGQLLATAFVSRDKPCHVPLRKVPLELVRCNPQVDEKACGLVQLRHTFPAELMYSEYWYLSGVNQTMRNALKEISEEVSKRAGLKPGDTIIDIGCNDGTLFNSYAVDKLDKVGFDPAQNLAGGKDEGFVRIPDFFNKESFERVRPGKKAKVVTSIAMFYDLEDPNKFTADVAGVLDDNGLWVLQMADLPNMLKHNMFDNICHEHLCYYHLAPLEILFKRHGLRLLDIEKNYVNGSSYRLYIGKAGGLKSTPEGLDRVARMRFEEFNMALDTEAPYREFEDNIKKNKHDLMSFLKKMKSSGKKVFVYGASTKGNVLLQYCGITPDLVPFAAERNPRKWGMLTIGTNIPIISEEEARAQNPDFFLVLPYHFLDEMIEREKDFINRGGKFIIPVPTVRLVPE